MEKKLRKEFVIQSMTCSAFRVPKVGVLSLGYISWDSIYQEKKFTKVCKSLACGLNEGRYVTFTKETNI